MSRLSAYSGRLDCAQEILLLLAKESLSLNGQDDFRMKVLDGLREETMLGQESLRLPRRLNYLNGHLGYDWLVHQRVPPLLDLIQGKVTGELHTAKNRDQVVSLKQIPNP